MASTTAGSPLRAAAELIQTLDVAYAEMTNNAADAAKDAEDARKNARAASEIARRYIHRSYPEVQSSFGDAPSQRRRNTNPEDEDDDDDDDEEEKTKGGDPLTEISGISNQLETQQHNQQLPEISPPDRRKRIYKNPFSSETIAQSHAEDVLNLTLELERTRSGFKSEQRLHQETKASLADYKSKYEAAEAQNQRLVKESANQKQTTQTITNLEQELANVKLRHQAADEDAELALELAKESFEKQEHAEALLQKALEEIEMLKAQRTTEGNSTLTNSETPSKRSVRFSDEVPPPPKPPPPPPPPVPPADSSSPVSSHPLGAVGAPRSMVAVGRQLLRRSKGSSPDEEVVTLELTPGKSAERRRRLRERLVQLEEDVSSSPDKKPPASPPPRMELVNPLLHKKLIEECQKLAKILQESGHRLELGGHWWRRDPSAAKAQQQHDIHLEAMTRQYAQSVEVSYEELFLVCLYVG